MNLMEKLANTTGLSLDDSGENRLHYDNELIAVFAHLMTRKEYAAMEKDLATFKVIGPGFEIHGWNDSSGYDYWKGEGENVSDSNYIQVTAYISDASIVNAKELKRAVIDVHGYFRRYHNMDRHFACLAKQG